MYLKVKNRKFEVIELTKFGERFKELKFKLEKLDYVAKFPNRKIVTTVFFCQNIDIIMTDKEDKILCLYANVKSEKYFFPRLKVKNVYFLPLGCAKEFKIGEKIELKKK